MAGQSLIRASELRAATVEQSRFITAVHTFRDKYFALPGDFRAANSVWTTASNGNGDGMLYGAGANGVAAEIFQFWHQLALAGLIEGSYTGLTAASGDYNGHIPGTNVPRSKVPLGGWSTQTRNNYPGDGIFYAYHYGNALFFGGTDTTDVTRVRILKPEEAWNIDGKVDDGLPRSGTVFAGYSYDCTTKTDGNTSALTDTSGVYNLSRTTVSCALAFVRAY